MLFAFPVETSFMKIYKFLAIAVLGISSLVQTRCGSASVDTPETMTLSQPSFVKSSAYFNTYVAGVQEGGSGIEFYLEVEELPEDFILDKVFFRESAGKLMRGDNNYSARFRTDNVKGQDIIMSSDPKEEAVNTPPAQLEKFPFPLGNDEAGVTYREEGVLKYAKISNIIEKPGIAYPSAPPRDGGH